MLYFWNITDNLTLCRQKLNYMCKLQFVLIWDLVYRNKSHLCKAHKSSWVHVSWTEKRTKISTGFLQISQIYFKNRADCKSSLKNRYVTLAQNISQQKTQTRWQHVVNLITEAKHQKTKEGRDSTRSITEWYVSFEDETKKLKRFQELQNRSKKKLNTQSSIKDFLCFILAGVYSRQVRKRESA